MVALVALKLVRGVIPPIAPVKRRVPLPPARVNASAPLSVLLNVMLLLLSVIVLVPVNTTGLGKARGFVAAVMVILAPISMRFTLVKTRGFEPERVTFAPNWTIL